MKRKEKELENYYIVVSFHQKIIVQRDTEIAQPTARGL